MHRQTMQAYTQRQRTCSGARPCRATTPRVRFLCHASATLDAPAAVQAEDPWLARNITPLATTPSSDRLASLSAASRQALHSLRVPTSRNEEYRYTDLAPLTRSCLSAAPATAHVDSSFVSDLALKGAEGSTVVLVNGAFRPDLSSISGLPAGAYIGSISQAPKEAAELIGSLSSSKGGPFAVVNGALAADALCVAAPANTSLAAPIHLICINTSAPAAAAATTSSSGTDADAQRCCSAPRLLVALAAGSEAEVVEEVVSVGTSSNHTSFAVTEVHLSEGASLKYGYVQREAAGAQQFKSTLVSQGASSSFKLVESRTGGSLVRHDLGITQVGPDTSTVMRHFLLAGSEQLQDLHSKLVLDHPRGEADQLHKCIVSSATGRGVFDGNVKVNRFAQKTDAGQLSRNLLLVPKATVNVKPNLQIIADDVKCTHGCAISDLSQEELFYFRARGIDAEAARQALVYSFGAEVVQELKHDALEARIQKDVVGILQVASLGKEPVVA